MSFFSWFRSKSEKAGQDELELRDSTKVTETHGDAGVRPPTPPRSHSRLRETIPQTPPLVSLSGSQRDAGSQSHAGSQRDVRSQEPFRTPVRATVDVPLQVLLQQLPSEVLKSGIDLDPKRRVQIPRRSLQVDEAHRSATVTLATVFAACPEIFALPISVMDQRTLQFNLPAWEQSRSLEPSEKPIKEPQVQAVGSADETLAPNENRQTGDKISTPELETSLAPMPTDEMTPATRHEELSDVSSQPASTALRSIEVPSLVPQNGSDAPKTLRLALGPILKNLPPEYRPSDIGSIADQPGLTIDVPFDVISSQLANGRVTIPFPTFLGSLPEEARSHFAQTDAQGDIPIPIKEILQEYPQNLLRPHKDQEPEEIVPSITTPFSAAAKEDRERFSQVAPALEKEEKPDSQQLELIESAKSPAGQQHDAVLDEAGPKQVVSEAPGSEAKKPEPNFAALQSIFLTEEPLDLKQVIQRVAELPGVSSALLFAGGKILEGEPEMLGLTQSAVALFSDIMRGVDRQAESLGLGKVETVTLGWKRELISVFSQGDLGILIRHAKRPFKPGVREKISLVLSHIGSNRN